MAGQSRGAPNDQVATLPAASANMLKSNSGIVKSSSFVPKPSFEAVQLT